MRIGTGTLLRTGEGRLRLLWRLLLFMGLALVVMVVVALLLPATVLSGSVAMLAGGVIGGTLLLALEGRRPGALGFYADVRALSETSIGVALGVGVGLVTVGMMALLGGVRWVPEAGSVTGWLSGGASALLFFLLPAAAEEAVLRGYPLQALSEAWGAGWALGITSIAFGTLHLSNPNVTALGVVNVAMAGAFLGVVYLKTGSLWWATGAHVGWNWSHGYLSDMPVSGLELMDAPFYQGVTRGPAWLGGASFGPEGSLVATVVLLCAIVVCWRAPWLRPSGAALAAEPLALIESSG